LLPGPFATDRLKETMGERARKTGKSIEELIAERGASLPAGRIGDPAEFGDACAYLCGARSGFMTGQNILLDGGSYPGTH